MKLALFNHIPGTESQIKDLVFDTREKILSGDYHPLDVEIQLKAIEETIKRIRSDAKVKEYVMEQAEMEPDKSFRHGSAMITKGNRSTYNYGQDEEWVRIKKEEKKFADERKVREGKLRNSFTDSSTGEVVDKIFPDKITSYLSIKFDA